MRKIWIKMTAILLICLYFAGFTACGNGTVAQTAATPVTTETADKDPVIATVNGSPISRSEYLREYASMYEYYGQAGYAMDEEGAKEELQEYVLEMLVAKEALIVKAEELGITLTDEEKTQIRSQAGETFQGIKEDIRASLMSAADTKEEDSQSSAAADSELEQKIQAQYEKTLQENYFDEESYIKYFEQQEIVYKLRDFVQEQVTVDEAQARAWYEQNLAEQKEAIETDAAAYDAYQNTLHLYLPQGSVEVLQLLIRVDDSKSQEAAELYAMGKQAQAWESLEDEFQKIQARAQEAQKRAESAKDFAALIREYNEAQGLSADAGIESLVVPPDSEVYVKEFADAALALEKDGEVSGLVKTYYGYHIIKRIRDVGGAVDFEAEKNAIMAAALEEKKDQAWAQQSEDWKNAAEVTLYRDALSD